MSALVHLCCHWSVWPWTKSGTKATATPARRRLWKLKCYGQHLEWFKTETSPSEGTHFLIFFFDRKHKDLIKCSSRSIIPNQHALPRRHQMYSPRRVSFSSGPNFPSAATRQPSWNRAYLLIFITNASPTCVPKKNRGYCDFSDVPLFEIYQ